MLLYIVRHGDPISENIISCLTQIPDRVIYKDFRKRS